MNNTGTTDARALGLAYLRAKRAVIAAGFSEEISWQEDACDSPLTEQRFLSEAAWVVLNAGMRETVIRRVFPQITAAFAKFETAGLALAAASSGKRKALRVFGHRGKIDAIVDIIRHLDEIGLPGVLGRLNTDGCAYLETLPYVGPVTAFHLAKNLGLNVVKPDRHLSRLATATGFSDAHALCAELGGVVGEPVPVIDIVLWRFATLSRDYLSRFVREVTSCRAASRREVLA